MAERGPCRWCELERQGLYLFVAPFAGDGGAARLDLAALERALAELPVLAGVPPPPAPREFAERGEPLAPPLRRQRRLWLAGALVGIVVVLEAARHLGFSPLDFAIDASVLAALLPTRAATGAVRRERRAALAAARERYDTAARQWYALADLRDLEQRRVQVRNWLAAYRALPAKYTAERARLEADKPRQQLRAFLDTYSLEDTVIPGIGKRRKATLRSYGIESALDVDEKLDRIAIPGFGKGRRGTLKSWVFVLKRMFRYDATRPVDPAALDDLQRREARERLDLERELRGAPDALAAQIRQRLLQRDQLGHELARLAAAVAKARADYAALRRL